MNHLKRTIIASAIIAASAVSFSASSFAAEPIIGKWKRDAGTIIEYKQSGSQFCATVLNGKYKGEAIGCMSGSSGNYKGKIKKLDEKEIYSGKAKVTGNSLKLSGCVAAGLICKSETLKRQ